MGDNLFVLGETGHVTATIKGDATMAIQIDCHGMTDIGKKRLSNERSNRTEDQAEAFSCIPLPGTDA